MSGTGYAILKRIGLIVGLIAVLLIAANAQTPKQRRDRLVKAHRDGNYKVAYEGLRKLALDPKADPKQVGDDLDLAIHCLNALGRTDEIDDFREAVIAVHAKNWRLLHRAAASFAHHIRTGQLVAGKFVRGSRSDAGSFVSSLERDRVRAMQLYLQALALAEKEKDKSAVAQMHLDFARMVLSGDAQRLSWLPDKEATRPERNEVTLELSPRESWLLQYRTDLSAIPDFEESNEVDERGAPVDELGNPIFYRMPKTLADAANDGERWRWLLARSIELNPDLASEIDWRLASFFRNQFGVWSSKLVWSKSAENSPSGKSGTFDRSTLKDTETIADLATGLKRFSLPDEFNWIKIYERIAARGKSDYGLKARDALADVYERRCQYVKAAAAWRKAIAEYGAGEQNERQYNLDQIVGNWGRFENGSTQPAGKKAVVSFRFRNGKKVIFETHAVKVDTLLADVKKYIKENTRLYDPEKVNITNIGWRLVNNNETKYIGEKVGGWTQTLEPRTEYVDSHITITTPLEKPGAYLLTGKMENGNISRVIVWLNDTVLLRKHLDGKTLYFVGDLVDGKPIANATVEYFGWSMARSDAGERTEATISVSRKSNAEGWVIMTSAEVPIGCKGMMIARKKKDGFGGADRFTYFGFDNVWYGKRDESGSKQVKSLAITDRPVYRPGDIVKFKVCVRHVAYDQPEISEFAHRTFKVIVRNAMREKVYEKNLTTDEFAGLSGEWRVPKHATLGDFIVEVDAQESGSFRVEEYKKPEYEVKVALPWEPIRLGERIETTIRARYYFGAPVTRAKVKYILHSAITLRAFSSNYQATLRISSKPVGGAVYAE